MWIAQAFVFLALAADDPLRLAEQHIAQGRYQPALDAIAQQPVTLRRHLIASKAYDGLNDPARAVREAEAALAIDPRSEAAHLQLGQIFLSHNTPQAATDVFDEALRLLPDSFFLRLGRGLARKSLLRYEDAELDLKACLEQRPDFAIAFDALATVYLQTKRFEDLEALAKAFRARNPKDYRAPYFEAAARDGAKQESPDIDSLIAESIRLNPNFAASRALLGKRRLNAGDPDGAIQELELALRLRPDYTPAAFHLAQAYQKAGRKTEAQAALNRFRQLQEKENTPPPTLRYHRGN